MSRLQVKTTTNAGEVLESTDAVDDVEEADEHDWKMLMTRTTDNERK